MTLKQLVVPWLLMAAPPNINAPLVIEPENDSPLSQLRHETLVRSGVIGLLQLGGVVALCTSAFLYRAELEQHAWVMTIAKITCAIPAIAFLFYFVILAIEHCFGTPNWILRLARRQRHPIDASESVTWFCAYLIVLDGLMVATITTPTGGPFQSPFSPLLWALLGTALTLRLPRRACYKVVVVISMLLLLSYCISKNFFRFSVVYSDDYENSLFINLIAAAVLTVAAGIDWMFDPLPAGILNRAFAAVSSYDVLDNRPSFHLPMERAYYRYIHDLSLRSDRATVSVVHELGTIFEQAIILSLPQHELGPKLSESRAAVTYLTFMLHWFDDWFDGLHCEWKSFDYAHFTAAEISACSWHLQKSRRRMFYRLSLELTWRERFSNAAESTLSLDWRILIKNSFDRSEIIRFRRLLDLALERIVLAAYLQRCEDLKTIQGVFQNYVARISELGDRQEILPLYQKLAGNPETRVILWATSKVVLDAFDWVSGPQSFHPLVSELYSLLYAPIMVYQNLEREQKSEGFSTQFKENVLHGFDHAKLEKVFLECLMLFRQEAERLKKESVTLQSKRIDQLTALFGLYGSVLPSGLQNAYQDLIKNWGNLI